jgi:predicted transcriptional regulator
MNTREVKAYLHSVWERKLLKEFSERSGISYSTMYKIVTDAYPNIKLATAEKIEAEGKKFERYLKRLVRLAS